MRSRGWWSGIGLLLAIAAGAVGGITLAILATPLPAFTFNQVTVVSWRGQGDAVPPGVETSGWAAPMFYPTPAEGAVPDQPEGVYPTGLWAPGDLFSRALMVRNVEAEHMVRLEGLGVRLRGDESLAPWFQVTVTGTHDQVLYEGKLSEFTAADYIVFAEAVELLRGAQQELVFTLSLDRDTDQRYEGKTVKADFIILASRFQRPTIIDIHPASWPNPINVKSSGGIPVAINGSDSLDVRRLDWTTARFGPADAPPLRGAFEDWNGDGHLDLVLHFATQETGITCHMTSATLRIHAFNGEVYSGTDTIVTPGC